MLLYVGCEQWLNLEGGIHQELVNQLTSTFFSACFGFWRWLERQNAIEAHDAHRHKRRELNILRTKDR